MGWVSVGGWQDWWLCMSVVEEEDRLGGVDEGHGQDKGLG